MHGEVHCKNSLNLFDHQAPQPVNLINNVALYVCGQLYFKIEEIKKIDFFVFDKI